MCDIFVIYRQIQHNIKRAPEQGVAMPSKVLKKQSHYRLTATLAKHRLKLSLMLTGGVLDVEFTKQLSDPSLYNADSMEQLYDSLSDRRDVQVRVVPDDGLVVLHLQTGVHQLKLDRTNVSINARNMVKLPMEILNNSASKQHKPTADLPCGKPRSAYELSMMYKKLKQGRGDEKVADGAQKLDEKQKEGKESSYSPIMRLEQPSQSKTQHKQQTPYIQNQANAKQMSVPLGVGEDIQIQQNISKSQIRMELFKPRVEIEEERQMEQVEGFTVRLPTIKKIMNMADDYDRENGKPQSSTRTLRPRRQKPSKNQRKQVKQDVQLLIYGKSQERSQQFRIPEFKETRKQPIEREGAEFEPSMSKYPPQAIFDIARLKGVIEEQRNTIKEQNQQLRRLLQANMKLEMRFCGSQQENNSMHQNLETKTKPLKHESVQLINNRLVRTGKFEYYNRNFVVEGLKFQKRTDEGYKNWAFIYLAEPIPYGRVYNLRVLIHKCKDANIAIGVSSATAQSPTHRNSNCVEYLGFSKSVFERGRLTMTSGFGIMAGDQIVMTVDLMNHFISWKSERGLEAELQTSQLSHLNRKYVPFVRMRDPEDCIEFVNFQQ